MPFARKNSSTTALALVTQGNVAQTATEALQKARMSQIQLAVRLTCDSPILMHRWTQKAITQMLGKMTGRELPRPPKDLTEECNNAWYRNTKGVPAVPCRIIKAAIIEGAIGTGGVVTKAELKRSLRVVGLTSPIHLSRPIEHDIKIAKNNGSVDLRGRAIAPEGSYFDVVLQFPQTLSVDKVMSALGAAGAQIGICDWRPDTGGEYGTFHPDVLGGDPKTIQKIIQACAVPEEEFHIPERLLRAFNAMSEDKLTDPARKVKSLIKEGGPNGPRRGTKDTIEDELIDMETLPESVEELQAKLEEVDGRSMTGRAIRSKLAMLEGLHQARRKKGASDGRRRRSRVSNGHNPEARAS
jgi:hypothetical protein